MLKLEHLGRVSLSFGKRIFDKDWYAEENKSGDGFFLVVGSKF